MSPLIRYTKMGRYLAGNETRRRQKPSLLHGQKRLNGIGRTFINGLNGGLFLAVFVTTNRG